MAVNVNHHNRIEVEVAEFCESLGFNRKHSEKLKSIIKNENDLNRFKMFIIENDGKYRSNLELIFTFVKAIEEEEQNYHVEEFITDFEGGEKEKALKTISKGMYNGYVIQKVEELLKKGLTSRDIYNSIVNSDVNVFHSLKELENKV